MKHLEENCEAGLAKFAFQGRFRVCFPPGTKGAVDNLLTSPFFEFGGIWRALKMRFSPSLAWVS